MNSIHLDVKVYNDNRTSEVDVVYGDKNCKFTAGTFTKKNLTPIGVGVFDYLNGYWATLPHATQQEIFNIYSDIIRLFESIGTPYNKILDEATIKVKRLMEINSLSNISNYLYSNGLMRVPSDIPKEFKVDIDKINSKEKTYIHEEYCQLIVLSIALRPLIPIWGEFIHYTRGGIIDNIDKETECMRLLSLSPDILDSVPMARLNIYVDSIVGKTKDDIKYALNSISPEDHPHWMSSMVCVKRLVVLDLSGENVIRLIHKFIDQKIKGDKSDFSKIIREKVLESADDDGGKLSTIESFKAKYNVSVEQLAHLNLSMEKSFNLLKHYLPDALEEDSVYQMFLISSKRMLEKELQYEKLFVLSWYIKPFIPPHSVFYLNKLNLCNLFAGLAYYCYTKKQIDLSMLLISECEIVLDKAFSSNVYKSAIPHSLIEEFSKVFPLVKKENPKNKDSKHSNYVMNQIINISNMFPIFDDGNGKISDKQWYCLLEDELMVKIGKRRKINFAFDLKIELIKLAISLEQ